VITEIRKWKSDNLVVVEIVGVAEVVIVIFVVVVDDDHQMINEGQWRRHLVVDYGVEKDE
jgi:hypothetical protein